MAASLNDKITDIRNAARPNSARVSSSRSPGGTTLACDNLTGWPTASKVHFVTYQIDSNSNPVDGTQLDCQGIVSGSNIGSFEVIDGTDNGNAVNDVVEMLPTAAWGQDLADALMAEHDRDGTHAAITATSVSATGNITSSAGSVKTDSIIEQTSANGVTIDGLNIKDGGLNTNASVSSESLNATILVRAYRNAAVSYSTEADIVFDTENFDLGSDFSTSTGIFTAPNTGYYQVYVQARITNLGDGDTANLRVYGNGVQLALSTIVGASVGGDPTVTASDVVSLTAGQEIKATMEISTSRALAVGSTSVFITVDYRGA